MVFVAGPRQVGKTTLALSLPGAEGGYQKHYDWTLVGESGPRFEGLRHPGGDSGLPGGGAAGELDVTNSSLRITKEDR
jgi:hypothetical protein